MTDFDTRFRDNTAPKYSQQKDGDASSFAKEMDGRVSSTETWYLSAKFLLEIIDQYTLPAGRI
jgi:hypothetical protein